MGAGGSFGLGQQIQIWNAMMEDAGTAGTSTTNFLPYSQRLTAATWGVSGGGLLDNSATAPDGTQTASTATAVSGSTDGYFIDSVPNSAPLGGLQVTASVWLRSANPSQNLALTLIKVLALVGFRHLVRQQ